MQKKLHSLFLSFGIAVFPSMLFAQIETRPSDVLKSDQASLAIRRESAAGELAAHLKRMEGKDLKSVSNAVRAAEAVQGKTVGSFIYYNVPAISENQYLPDAYPLDGIAQKQIQIIMAQDEYEPGSFLIYPLKDMGKVQLSLSEFKSKEGKVFPASALDLKTIKVWYQNGNAWCSYFGDTELKLVPELLLNDEDLIKVDTEKVQNYARLTEDDGRVHYQWITPPREMDNRVDKHYRSNSTFLSMKKNYRDAKTIQPVLLKEGKFKQFFLTAHAEKDQAPGIYRGVIRLTSSNGEKIGEIPASIRVLPFVLPAPKTYYDVNKDFLVGSYSYLSMQLNCLENGGDMMLAWKQLEAVLRNQVAHGQTMHLMRDLSSPVQWDFVKLLEIFKRVGIRTDIFVGIHPAGFVHNVFVWDARENTVRTLIDPAIGDYTFGKNNAEWKQDAKIKRNWMLKNMGHTNALLQYGDEPPADWVMRQRSMYKIYQEAGFKFFIAGQENVLFKAGYLYDFFNLATDPAVAGERVRPWNEIGRAHVAAYAGPHVGPENPALNRRQYGLGSYLSNFSADFNYAHHLGPYNDRSEGYRPMVFAYGSYDGVIDTLQWEGFREGIDDIRYATMMKTLALEASASKNIETQYAGRLALQFLALSRPEKIDLNSARYEMIRHILKLKSLLNK